MRLTIWLVMCILIAGSVTALGSVLGNYEAAEQNVDLGWYELEDWELATCQDFWAGSGIPGRIPEETGITDLTVYSNDIIVTLNAEVSGPIPYNETQIAYLYEVSWYVQPIWTAVNGEVTIQDSDGDNIGDPIWSGSSTMESGFSGYYVLIEPEDSDIKAATLKVLEADLELTVPFVTDLIYEEQSWMDYFNLEQPGS